MLPFTGNRPQLYSIAAAVQEKMARNQQAAALKATSAAQKPSTPTKRKHDELDRGDITIDFNSDSDDSPARHKAPRLASSYSTVDTLPITPRQGSPRSPIESPRSPVKTSHSLLHSTLNTFASPRSPVESPRSPLEETVTQGSSFQTHQNSTQHADTEVVSPRSPIESPNSLIEEIDLTSSEAHQQAGLPTPGSTPQKPKELYDYPELSNRYIPSASVEGGFEYRNPQKFCLKPAYWRKWAPKAYVLFAEELRKHFDPVPFAQLTGMPIDEITHVFNAVVCNPLYDAKEATRRGEEGMQGIVKLYRNSAVNRPWGKEGQKRVLGEIKGVEPGKVELVLAKSGHKKVMALAELGEGDKKYLSDSLTEEHRRVLLGRPKVGK